MSICPSFFRVLRTDNPDEYFGHMLRWTGLSLRRPGIDARDVTREQLVRLINMELPEFNENPQLVSTILDAVNAGNK
jgi:hypothetical protein